MAEKYKVTAPDGKSYFVEVPDGTGQEKALEGFKSRWATMQEGIQREEDLQSWWGAEEQWRNAIGLGSAPGYLAGEAVRPSPRYNQEAGRLEVPSPRASSTKEALQKLSAGRKAYVEENPEEATLIDAVGSLPGVMTGLGAIERGIMGVKQIPLATRRFLTGRGGTDAAGRVISRGTQAASMAAQGGRQAAETALLTSQLAKEPLGDRLLPDIALGAALGGTVGPAVAKGFEWWRGPVMSKERADLAKSFRDAGIDIRASHMLEGSSFSPKQQEELTRALARSFGEDLPKGKGLSSRNLDLAQKRIQGDLDSAAQNSGVMGDQNLLDRLQDIENRMAQTTGVDRTDMRKLRDLINQVRRYTGATYDPINNAWVPYQTLVPPTGTGNALVPHGTTAWMPNPQGAMTGEQYQEFTRHTSPLMKSARQYTVAGEFARDIREALDEALESSAGPDAAEAVRTARREYRNWLVAKDAMGKGSERDIPEGFVDPRGLYSSAKKYYKNLDTQGTPGSNLENLARGSEEFFRGPAPEPWKLSDYVNLKNPRFRQGLGNAAMMMGPSAASYAATQHPLAAVLAMAPGLAYGANQLRRGSASYADDLIERAYRARAVPTSLQPGLRPNPLAAPSTAIITELYNKYREQDLEEESK